MQRIYDWKISFSVCAIAMFILTIAMVGTAAAKSVYLSANHHTRQFDAWNINPDGTVTKQATYMLQHSTDPSGIGIDALTGLGNDPLMFISSEFSAGIEVVNPVTLTYFGVSTGPTNLAGVDVDDVDNIIYTLRRQTNNLYIYTYNDDGSGITQQAMIVLPNHGWGYGLAFDDFRDILWVSDAGNWMVKAYDTNVANWSDISEIPALSFPVSQQRPVDVAVDRQRNIVYTVGGWHGARFLTKYDVNTQIGTAIDLGVGGIGVAVDEVTGYVYITRGTSSSGDDVQVWDCSTSPFTLLQDTPRIGNPAGLAIANVSYNPLNLAKNDTIQGYGVDVGGTFTYEITYDNMGNPFPVTNVTAVDTMPVELDYVSSTPAGVYDLGAHTVTWDLGTLPAGYSGGLIELVVRVNQAAVPGSTIYNYCTIESEETPPTTVEGKDPDNPDPGEPGTYVFVPADLWAVEYRYGAPPPGWDMSNMPLFKSWLEVRIENQGSGDALNVVAYINDNKPTNVTFAIPPETEDREVALGDIPAASSTWSAGDTFTIIVDMSNQQGPMLGIHWDIEYDDASGNHHVIENVPEFPWCPGAPPLGEMLARQARLWYPQQEPIPTVSMLHPNFPNPFNPETWLPYQLANDADVSIRIFDVRGQLVKMLELGRKEAGFYKSRDRAAYWDGRNQWGEKVSSGVYFYILEAGKFTATRKMVIVQ